MKRESVVGKSFGTLVIINELNDLIVNNRNFRFVKAICECGFMGEWRLNTLRTMQSCGCKTAVIARMKLSIHGLTKHPLFRHWQNMKNRCYNKKTESYGYCGAKGVIVCKEWKHDFKMFYDWEEGLTLDRFPDVHGDYEPSNCRWANDKQQANNKTTSVIYTYKGQSKTLAEFATQYGFNYKKAHTRIKYLKWSIENAIEK